MLFSFYFFFHAPSPKRYDVLLIRVALLAFVRVINPVVFLVLISKMEKYVHHVYNNILHSCSLSVSSYESIYRCTASGGPKCVTEGTLSRDLFLRVPVWIVGVWHVHMDITLWPFFLYLCFVPLKSHL